MEKQPDQSLVSEENLESELGMFHMEITSLSKDAYELIEISKVSELQKEKCNEILDQLIQNSIKKDQKVVDLCYYAVLQLKNVLSSSDDEENQLFEGVRGVVYKARDSALGWKKEN